MSRCFCSLKNFSQSRTQSPSRLWVARRAGRPGPCGASPADSRSPRCWQTPGLRAKETPKRQRRKLPLAWLTFFCGTCKRCGRCRFGCEQQQRRILMVIVVVFDRKKPQKKQLMWRFENGGRRRSAWNQTKATKATWSATDTMKGRSKEKKNYVRMMNCGHGWTQWGFLHKCGVDRGSGKRG